MLEGLAISTSKVKEPEEEIVDEMEKEIEEEPKEEVVPQPLTDDEKLERAKKILRILEGNVGEDMIGKLLDVESPMERSTSPSIGFVLLQVYLRQGAKYFDGEVGDNLEGLADIIASAMIPYRDKRMEHIQEILKKAPESVQVVAPEPEPPRKRRFWERKPKEEFE